MWKRIRSTIAIYKIKLFVHLCVCYCWPNGWIQFLKKPVGTPTRNIFFNFFLITRATPGTSASLFYIYYPSFNFLKFFGSNFWWFQKVFLNSTWLFASVLYKVKGGGDFKNKAPQKCLHNASTMYVENAKIKWYIICAPVLKYISLT